MTMMLKVREHHQWSWFGSNALVQTNPSAVDRAAHGAPFAGGHKQKCPPATPKRRQTKTLIDQVKTQIELPPYCGARCTLDLVAIEIIFGRLFEVFRHTTQAASIGSSAGGNTQPPKKKKHANAKVNPCAQVTDNHLFSYYRLICILMV
jgi:hypothetical protein